MAEWQGSFARLVSQDQSNTSFPFCFRHPIVFGVHLYHLHSNHLFAFSHPSDSIICFAPEP